jgi:hypothetical protein
MSEELLVWNDRTGNMDFKAVAGEEIETYLIPWATVFRVIVAVSGSVTSENLVLPVLCTATPESMCLRGVTVIS